MLSPKSQDYPCAPCLLHPRTNNVLDIIDEHHILKQLTYPSLLILASHAMSWLWNLRRRQNRACTIWLLADSSKSSSHSLTNSLNFFASYSNLGFFYVILFNLLWIHRHTFLSNHHWIRHIYTYLTTFMLLKLRDWKIHLCLIHFPFYFYMLGMWPIFSNEHALIC